MGAKVANMARNMAGLNVAGFRGSVGALAASGRTEHRTINNRPHDPFFFCGFDKKRSWPEFEFGFDIGVGGGIASFGQPQKTR